MDNEPSETERLQGADGIQSSEEELDIELEQTVLDDDGQWQDYLRAREEGQARTQQEQNAILQEEEVIRQMREEHRRRMEILIEKKIKVTARLRREREDMQRQIEEFRRQQEENKRQQDTLDLQQVETQDSTDVEQNSDGELSVEELTDDWIELENDEESAREQEEIARENEDVEQLFQEILRRMDRLSERHEALGQFLRQELAEIERQQAIIRLQQGQQLEVLSEEDIERMPIVKVNQQDVTGDTKCSICYEDFVFDEKVAELNCDHIFHHGCVVPWLQRSISCPLCRAVVDPSEWPENPTSEPEHENTVTPDE